ncbi:hypothetical protein OG333_36920 [Streptomyces anulatus]|uniref:hypothetical protein n=1 Tax=Streptomyces anulatus TaxID=1892 RepID=UPI003869783D|nr:hypothetical protein OG333_36920 [Streptomyces anulatus]
MNLRARLRTSPAVWSAPVWVGIIVFYFFYVVHLEDSRAEVVAGPLWAAEQVALVLSFFYAFAYALTVGLAVWEGGRLVQDGVWALAPARTRVRVAVHALAPSVAAGWLVLAVPVVMRLVETGLLPSPAAVAPLLMGMGIVCAYALLGCVLGHVAPRVIAAPLACVTVFYFVSGSGGYSDPVWPRHTLGQIDTSLAFGEHYGVLTVLLPFLFIAAVAGAVAAWWLPTSRRWLVRTAAFAVALCVGVACAREASGWGFGDGPVVAGNAPVRCVGEAPRVCMAETGGAIDSLHEVRTQVVGSVHRLQAAGVRVKMPDTVSDALLAERHRKRSSATQWWLPLSRQAGESGGGMVNIRYAVLLASVQFPCTLPTAFEPGKSADWVVPHDAATLWAAQKIDAEAPYLAWRRSEYGAIQNADEVLEKVRKLADDTSGLTSETEQKVWFHDEQQKACKLAGQA